MVKFNMNYHPQPTFSTFHAFQNQAPPKKSFLASRDRRLLISMMWSHTWLLEIHRVFSHEKITNSSSFPCSTGPFLGHITKRMRLEPNKSPQCNRNDRKPDEKERDTWLVVKNRLEKLWSESQWEGWHPFFMKWKMTNVPKHQSDTVKSSFSESIASPSYSLSISIRKHQTKIHLKSSFSSLKSHDFPTKNLPTSRHSDHFPEKSQHFAPQKTQPRFCTSPPGSCWGFELLPGGRGPSEIPHGIFDGFRGFYPLVI